MRSGKQPIVEHSWPTYFKTRQLLTALNSVEMHPLWFDAHKTAGAATQLSPDHLTKAVTIPKESAPGTDSPMEKVLRRIGRTADFPSISKYVIRINKKLSDNSLQSSASELANMILKDYALTNKLLKLVNSAFYGFLTCKVTTVTRAVVVLGYDNVRLAAVSLLLFDHFKSRSEARDLKDAAISSFWCGLISKEIARIQGGIDPEEAFICALLHQLGKLLTIHHLPEEYQEIRARLAQRKERETRAVNQVLGVSYKSIGLAVARQWSFPESILKTMEPLSHEALKDKGPGIDPLCAVANFSNALCGIINEVPEHREAAIKDLLLCYKNHIPISIKQLKALMDASQENLHKHADALQFSVKESAFILRLSSDASAAQAEGGAEGRDGAASRQAQTAPLFRLADDDVLDESGSGTDAEGAASILMSGVREVSSAMIGSYDVNDIALMTLEVIYRALQCQRALLFIHDGHSSLMEARFGYGPDIQRLVGRLQFPTGQGAALDLFSQALKKGKDLVVEDARAPQLYPLLPPWYRKDLDAKAFLFMPVIFQKICVAAYYADLDVCRPPVNAGEHENLSLLRNQLILAIKMRR